MKPITPRWRRWLTELIILILILTTVHAWQHKDTTTGVAPPLVAKDLNGQPISLTNFKGQPLLVHLFAPWCPVCVANHSNIIQMAQHYPVLVVAVQTEPDELQQWLNQHPEEQHTTNLTFAQDPQGQWLSAFGSKALPTSIFLDAHGRIVTTELGYITTLGLWLRLLWAS